MGQSLVHLLVVWEGVSGGSCWFVFGIGEDADCGLVVAWVAPSVGKCRSLIRGYKC